MHLQILQATFREALSPFFLPRAHQPELVEATTVGGRAEMAQCVDLFSLCLSSLRLGFRGASSTSIQPHLRDVADAMEGVKAADSVLNLFRSARQRATEGCGNRMD